MVDLKDENSKLVLYFLSPSIFHNSREHENIDYVLNTDGVVIAKNCGCQCYDGVSIWKNCGLDK